MRGVYYVTGARAPSHPDRSVVEGRFAKYCTIPRENKSTAIFTFFFFSCNDSPLSLTPYFANEIKMYRSEDIAADIRYPQIIKTTVTN